jgi:RNA polymerase sigma factor (sigma-70 family)
MKSEEIKRPENATNPGWFATTHWSLVVRATGSESPDGAAALASLCESYWRPIYLYIRRRGYSAHDAQDLTQGFFAFLLSRNHMAKADADRGRFRSFLLGTLKKFLSDQRDKANAQKRGGGTTTLSLDFESAERNLALNAVSDSDPVREFDRNWALSLLEQTMTRLQEEHRAASKGKLFAEIASAITGEKSGRPYSEIGEALGISEGSVKMAVMRARRRYGELLREEIAHTVASAADIDDEVRRLFESIRE